MKRETKVGIVVAASFVCLVGGVLFVKYVQDRPAATSSPDKTTSVANNTTTADRTNNPAPSPIQRSPELPANKNSNLNGGLPSLPGDLNEPFPPLPGLPPKPSNNTRAPAPVPSELKLPGENDDQQVVRSGSTNQPTSMQRAAPNPFPDMKPLPQVIPARADEPVQPPMDNKPMPMTLAPLDLPPGDSIKPNNDDTKPAPSPAPVIPGIDLPGTEKKDTPKPNTPTANGDGGITVVPPPGPVIEPPPTSKPEPKPDNSPLAPLPGVPTVNPPSVPSDGKPLELPPPKLEDVPKPMNPAKSDFPLPNTEPKIPPPPDTAKPMDTIIPTPKPMDTIYPNIQASPPGTIPIPKPNTEPSITPVPDRSNSDLPPLPPMPPPKNSSPVAPGASTNMNNLAPLPNQANPGAPAAPNIDRSPQTGDSRLAAPVSPANVMQPQIDSYDEEWYTTQASDTFEQLSQKFYATAKYAQALRQYNYDRTGLDTIRAGSTVRVPPARVLERKHPTQIAGLPPAAAAPSPRPGNRSAAMGLPQSVGDPVNFTRPTPDGGLEYTVRGSPKTLRDIAKETLNSSDKWNLIFRLNRWVNPDEPLPVDTKLRMPSDAQVPP